MIKIPGKRKGKRPEESILFDAIYLLGIVMVTWFLFRLSVISYLLLFWDVCVPSALIGTQLEYFGIYWPVVAMDAFVLAWGAAFIIRGARAGRGLIASCVVPAFLFAFVLMNLSLVSVLFEWRDVEQDPRAAYELLWNARNADREFMPGFLPPGEMATSRWSSCTAIEDVQFDIDIRRERRSKRFSFWRYYAERDHDGMTTALKIADRRLLNNPEDGEAWAMKSLVYGNAVDYGLASAAFAGVNARYALDKALYFAPRGPATDAAFGLVMQYRDSEAAETRLRNCIDRMPEFAECHNLLGDLLRKTGRPNEAIEIYQQGLELWPGNGELRVSYALSLQETGRPSDAIAYLEKLVEGQPRFARGHWHLAVMLYEENDDVDAARNHAVKALELDPNIWNGEILLLELLRAE